MSECQRALFVSDGLQPPYGERGLVPIVEASRRCCGFSESGDHRHHWQEPPPKMNLPSDGFPQLANDEPLIITSAIVSIHTLLHVLPLSVLHLLLGLCQMTPWQIICQIATRWFVDGQILCIFANCVHTFKRIDCSIVNWENCQPGYGSPTKSGHI